MVMMMSMILTNSFSLTSEVLPPTSLAARSSWLDARLSPPFSPAVQVAHRCEHNLSAHHRDNHGGVVDGDRIYKHIKTLHCVNFDKKDK